jgi:transposase-like protein
MDKAPQNPTSALQEAAEIQRDYWAVKRRLALQAGREGYSVWEISKRLGLSEAQVDDWLDDLESDA